MQYGHFDNEKREYVIDRVDLPVSWTNYPVSYTHLTDIEEGADIIMIKPAMSYLDMVSEVHKATNVPIAAYSVSGEYAMVKAAAKMGWIEEDKIVCEMAASAYLSLIHI